MSCFESAGSYNYLTKGLTISKDHEIYIYELSSVCLVNYQKLTSPFPFIELSIVCSLCRERS